MGISLLSRFFFICTLSIFCIINFTRVVCDQCLDDQKTILLELKAGLLFNSSVSKKLVQWNQTENCCNWEGVECDGAGHVIGLQLDNETISCGIDNLSTLFSFEYLEKLNLAYNNFNSIQIPRRIHNLTRLTQLNLSRSHFGGQVPIELSLMRRLVSLDLSSNYFSSLEIVKPNLRMLLQNLTNLRELYLATVHISSQGNEWSHVTSSNLDFIANFSSLTTLSLSSCSLKGHFPEIIFQVPTLQSLDLSYNNLLSGTLPEFHQTGSFRAIVLTGTNFSGSLSNSISNLTMLSDMKFSSCSFTGPLPTTLANLTQLVHVDLSSNFFSGSVPSFQMSKNLTYIALRSNNLTGSLYSIHLDALSNLYSIDLGFNSISGSIPQFLFCLPLLQELMLSDNQFSGQVNEVSTLRASKLEMLDLSNNKLEGPIPDFFFKLERLSILSLSSNSFNGTIELERFQGLPNLLRLGLSYNNLSVITSSSNSSLPTFPKLQILEIAFCNIHKFPDLIKHSKVTELDLSNNLIAGDIPSWIWEINHGEILSLNFSFNRLVDFEKPYRFPAILSILDLQSNQFHGELPLPPQSTGYADYSNNNFKYCKKSSGRSIPIYESRIGSFLSLANNSLSGAIPTSLCNFTSLAVLDLSLNNFSGGIPPCLLKELEILEGLNLEGNNLSGDIPDVFSVNCSLKALYLRENILVGKIPLSLARCKSLEVMNVGQNNIHDTFPCMLPSSLRVLVLRSNKFHGDVRCHASWPNLQIIDIASNNFSGYLYPRSFSSWRGMMLTNDATFRPYHADTYDFHYKQKVTLVLKGRESEYKEKGTVVLKGLELEYKILTFLTCIDFSSNNFKGEIPVGVGDLNSLHGLNLSHNILTGKIPKTIGNLRQLESLDLSTNQLTGEIPKELARLTFLSVLNLSYNKLVGMIPNGPQFQTFSSDSFEGNMGLCGFPLNRSCNNTEGNGAPTSEPKGEPLHEKDEIEWGFVSAALGFVVGLGSSLWLLWGCRSVRQKFSDQVDNILTKILNQKKRHGRRVPRNRVIRKGQ